MDGSADGEAEAVIGWWGGVIVGGCVEDDVGGWVEPVE